MSVKIVISGCGGRMGSQIATLALNGNTPPIAVAGAIEGKGHTAIGQDLGAFLGREALGVTITDDAKKAIQAGDVLIEFTRPEATMDHLQLAKALRKPMVIGTTGLRDDEMDVIRAIAKEIPIVFSPNMSIGVNLLFELVQIATERLGQSFKVKIIEAHHKGKKDSPSGTAKRLQELIADIRSRSSIVKDVVPCESIREGDIVGDHKVIFSGQYEHIELSHKALSRSVFALGALKAALFVAQQPPGLYDMSHVLAGAAR